MTEQKILIFSGNFADPSYDIALMGKDDGIGSVELSQLTANVRSLQPALESMVSSLKDAAGELGLKEVTLAVGINAKGAVGFLGTGAEAGGSATITLRFQV